MSIPKFLMIHTVSVTNRTGTGPYGDEYGKAYDMPCNFQFITKKIMSKEGTEVIANAQLFTNSDIVPTIKSIVTFEGIEYEVIKVNRLDNPLSKSSRKHHYEITLI